MMSATRFGRLIAALLIGLAMTSTGLSSPAVASASTESNPSMQCGEDDIYVRVTEYRGEQIVRELPIATHGGCASSWATNQMSKSAVVGQCKLLESGTLRPDGSFFQLTYPHLFYGIWPAENRSDCVKILHGLATGSLDADVLPFPF